MMIETINQSLLEADEQYIVHQLNCITKSAAGLAEAIFKRFPYADVYSFRNYPHTPTNNEVLGNIVIRGNGKDQRFVIGIYGQYFPGRPRYPDSKLDGYRARQEAFEEGLTRIAAIPNIESVAFPVGIGCTLAKGDWNIYRGMIEKFAEKIKTRLYNYK